MKKVIFSVIMILVVGGFVLGGAVFQPISAADKITLNLVSFVPKMNISYRGWAPLFIDKVNERSKGELTITYHAHRTW